MPNKERIKLLVDALRSGEYQQTTGTLETVRDGVQKNCCLGVACRVAIKNGLDIDIVEALYTTFAGNVDALPSEAKDWYDFPTYNPEVKHKDGWITTAIRLNDKDHYNFDEIADAFERMYLTNTEVETDNMLSSDDV